VRSIIQSTLPYNHRVLLQLLVSILTRMKDAAMDLDCALDALSGALFPPSFQPTAPSTRKALLELVASNSDTFPTSNVGVQYMVEKSSHGKMLVKSAERAQVLALLTHRFTQEPRTWAALLALHARWAAPQELVAELSAQHSRFVQAAATGPQPAPAWLQGARRHVLFVAQGQLELCPEIFLSEASWQDVRKASRAWQKECASDGGEPERRLRKWMKSAHKRVTTGHAELQTTLAGLLQLRQEGPSIDFAVLMRDVDPKAVAEQMSLIDSVFFRCVPKSELLLCDALSSASVETAAPNWFRMIQSFNAVSQWVVSVVLSAQLPSQRAEYIVYFLKIADHLQTVLANYNASYAVALRLVGGAAQADVVARLAAFSGAARQVAGGVERLAQLCALSRGAAAGQGAASSHSLLRAAEQGLVCGSGEQPLRRGRVAGGRRQPRQRGQAAAAVGQDGALCSPAAGSRLCAPRAPARRAVLSATPGRPRCGRLSVSRSHHLQDRVARPRKEGRRRPDRMNISSSF
jgi:hypothetical protein